jgi:D-3-phosphoglycerate dehydrogenase
MNNSTPTIAVTDWAFADLIIEEKVASEAGVLLSGRQCLTAEDLIAHCSEADTVITQFAKIDAGVIDRMQKALARPRRGCNGQGNLSTRRQYLQPAFKN